jgi:hypothetical protein
LWWLIEEDRTEMMADDLVVLCGDGGIIAGTDIGTDNGGERCTG